MEGGLRKTLNMRPPGKNHGALDTRLLDSLPDAAILTDCEGTIIYWNAGATKLFGWTAAEILGRPYIDRFPEPVRELMVEGIAKRLLGEDWEGEFQDFHRNGSRIWIHTCVSRIYDDNGQLQAFLGISHDISARKQAEEQLLETATPVGRSTDDRTHGQLELGLRFQSRVVVRCHIRTIRTDTGTS